MSHDQPPKFNKPPSGNAGPEIPITKGSFSEKMAGMRLSFEVGKKIQETFPDIAKDYEIGGLTQLALIKKYHIQEIFGVNNLQTALAAVWNALHGYPGNLFDSYPGLITSPDILQAVAKKHKEAGSRKVGNSMRDTGGGMFGMTSEKREESTRKGGVVGFNEKKGIHAQTTTERREASRAGVTKRGLVPFSEEEEAFMKGLDLNGEEYRTRGTKVNAKRIAKELNKKFHNGNDIRNRDAVGAFLRRIKKRDTP